MKNKYININVNNNQINIVYIIRYNINISDSPVINKIRK